LGLGGVSAHTFRHAYATNYLRKGGNMENLRVNMGHSTYDMVRRYLDLARQGSKEALAELEMVSLLKQVKK
jgi:integrase